MGYHWTWEENIYCPESHPCQNNLVSYDFGKVPGYVNVVSSSLSCLGSVFIVVVYLLFKDLQTGAQTVMTLLAIADFFIAFSYLLGSVNFNTAFGSKDPARCVVFISICEIQSFITTWSTMSSFCWTTILALYFFLVLVFRKGMLAEKLIPLYNVIAWLGPLCIVGPMLVFGKLGYAPYVTSNWCFIKDYSKKPLIEKPLLILYILLGRKLWEVISYIIVLVLYIWIRWNIRKTPKIRDSSSKIVEKWLLSIPIFYIILRIWGTLQFFYALAVSGIGVTPDMDHPGCIPQAVQIGYFIIAVFQAVGDGGQGWANALLLVIFSKSVRKRIFVNPMKKLSGYIQKTTNSSQSIVMHTCTRPKVFSEPSGTAPVSDRISYPSSTYCIISHTNHSDFTSAHNGNEP